MPHILAIHFSQSGQLTQIMDEFCSVFQHADVEKIRINAHFPFPWNGKSFFDAMPETVLETPAAVEIPKWNRSKYDLIIIGYQPWFLSPSQPITGLLQNESFRNLIAGTPVATVIGARNMWLNAHLSVTSYIRSAGGKHMANVALVDKSNNQLSAVSIVHWLFTGKKERKWGVFPMPGVSEEDIHGVGRFSVLIAQELECPKPAWEDVQPKLIEMGAVNIPTNILFIEERAKKIFRIWANLIVNKERKGGSRSFWIGFFKYYLFFALFIVAPILLTIFTVFIRPFVNRKMNKRKKNYQQLV